MSLRRQLAIVALVYVVEGLPMGVYADVWPVFPRGPGHSGFLTALRQSD